MKENKLFYLLISSIVVLIIGGWFGTAFTEIIFSPDHATAATSSQVTVSASVTATISCASDQSSTSFGTLTDSAVFTSSPNVSSTMSCANSAAGCTLYIKDAGNGSNPGLWNASASALIKSPDSSYSATSTLVAGTEGYGIQATTTGAGSGGTLTIAAKFNQTGNTVGGLTLTNGSLATTNTTSSNREVVVTHKAAISSVTSAGNYTDTITYECTAN